MADYEPPDETALPHESVDFVHESERQFAMLLDYYGIDWCYEPDTFVLEVDQDGQATLAFTPDFFLPNFDLYIEITTMRQSLVNRKNRKVRRLREQRPDLSVQILYQRDYLELLVKFGLVPTEALAGYGDLTPAGEERTESLLGLGSIQPPAGSWRHKQG